MRDICYNPLLHRTAQLTAAATLLLIFMGGLVTSHGAGLSVPDWPNSYGYNMFTFPPSKWIGGIFYEHTHRLMGTVVGMLSIALTIIAWKSEERKWVRWLATSVLFAVIFQGILGGLRVVLVKLDLAIVHACVAQAFFCLTALLAVVTSRWWLEAADEQCNTGLISLSAACGLAIFLQLILGATMRHQGAGLAIPDFPLNYGHLLPPNQSRNAGPGQPAAHHIESSPRNARPNLAAFRPPYRRSHRDNSPQLANCDCSSPSQKRRPAPPGIFSDRFADSANNFGHSHGSFAQARRHRLASCCNRCADVNDNFRFDGSSDAFVSPAAAPRAARGCN
ncbi:MAG TPA: COX15/CtaA family protein [Tepidisphaeraceae bacterium]